MKIKRIILLPAIEEKLAKKHRVSAWEVEDVLLGESAVYHAEKGNRLREDVYMAAGRTLDGRYLLVFFILKADKSVLILSARDMTTAERKRHAKK